MIGWVGVMVGGRGVDFTLAKLPARAHRRAESLRDQKEYLLVDTRVLERRQEKTKNH